MVIIPASLCAQGLEIPLVTRPGDLYEKEHYTLHYNETFEQADWVAYELTRREVMGDTERRDRFRSDKEIATGSAALSDYRGSGYDRGHLAPAADMKMDRESMEDSFLMSNMSPQVPAFNRGIWRKLESWVRTWAYLNESLYVVTGPVFSRAVIDPTALSPTEYRVIGPNEVAVPEYFFKVLLDYRLPEKKAIAFILPNQRGGPPLESYAVSVDAAEAFTGIDFFPALPDEEEEALESRFDMALWPPKAFRASHYRESAP